MNLLKPITTILILFLWLPLVTAQCRVDYRTFKAGEQVEYSVYYNFGFIWMDAAKAMFKVDEIRYKDENVFHFYSHGITNPGYDWIFEVRDTFQSYANATSLQPLWHKRSCKEGSYIVINQSSFNLKQKSVDYNNWNNKKGYLKGSFYYNGCLYDLLTAVYASRTLSFDQYLIGEKIPINVMIEEEIFTLYIRYLGKEIITIKDGRTFRCAKFSIMLVEGTVFAGGEDMTVWVSDDRNRVPVFIEAKILIGSVKASLSGHKGLMWPLSSQTNYQKP